MRKLNPVSRSAPKRGNSCFLGIGTSMRLIAILLCSLFSTAAFSAPTATDYGLKVAGVDVTSDNCADLSVIDGVKGTVSYDPATKTLTLQDATIDKADEFTIENKSVDGLKVNIVGTNNLSTTKFASISIEKTTTFQGSGTLKVKGNSYGISVGYDNVDIIIRDCKMYIEGEWGIDGFVRNTTLTIINANIEINSLKEVISRMDNLSLQRCAITEPAGAIFDASQRSIVVDGARVTGKLVIAPEKPVFKVAGVEVADANSGNLTTIAGVEGKASYDPETQTLTLDNATITTNAVAGIANESATGLQVKLVGNNTITFDQEGNMVVDGDIQAVTVYDLQGRQVLNSAANGTISNNLPAGIYVVRAQTGANSSIISKIRK